jgi:glycosyltransferase involved in cell wall biosynthesis
MFSVVIPLYNKAHIIVRTLASVLSQTYTEFEIIIVNDGSTDNSLTVINQFTLNDPRIRIIEQSNQGVSAARNNGVASARYNYIAFLDGDDEWLPGYLAKMKEAIELFPAAGMYGCSSWHRNVLTGETSDATLMRYEGKIQVVDFFENPHTYSHTSAIVVVKKVFNLIDNGNGFPVGMKCCEDWSCYHRLALLAPVVYIGSPLGIRNNGVDGQITGLSKKERFKLMVHVIDSYNLIYFHWVKLNKENQLFSVFLKYDLRSRIISQLRDNDYTSIQFLLDGLNTEVLSELKEFEVSIYKNKSLKVLAITYIYITKIIWRLHGFPRVGA